ncbi:winged helix-turn-helix transcriptional regulator [Krasilnikoviella flava]|uniref:Transcriptional regulator, HxlR family n=1 Tax=Krasilnikoviella flava TaxID=526729 RepID=A0A1T5LQY7_9MICO|nr:helix-turn-helix domain-containing protein [Krasilnikoviella flava]SKC78393.1 transcriptional regulator, HxlR family [Krasilnikoviella flava]
MAGYGQFCPVAKAMEVLDERWTLLVVRELLLGSTRFNELRRGNPKMSPTLLSKRLRTLERAGVVRRVGVEGHTRYVLTPAGEELRPVVEALGAWGTRWVGGLGAADLDPHLLLWDMRRTIDVAAWPQERTVLAIVLTDVAPRVSRWWVVVRDGQVEVCDDDPGYDATAVVTTPLRTLTRLWRGDVTWAGALRSGEVEVAGPEAARRRVPRWLGQSVFARVPRPDPAAVEA